MDIYEYDERYRKKYGENIAGVDEAGRGPLAGPVVVASLILPKDFYHPYLGDSKKISKKKREELYPILLEQAKAYEIVVIGERTIEEINILNSTLLGMKQGIEGLKIAPDFVLIDGNQIPKEMKYKSEGVVKGDSQSGVIGGASILAKVGRDRIMEAYDEKYPEYGFKRHKGYGTKEHYEKIREYGVTEIHRKTYLKKMKDR